MGMRLTDEMIQEDDKRFKRQDLLDDFNYCGKEVPNRKSITNDNIRFYAWLCRSAYTLLKEQDTVEHACDILRANGWKETEPLCSECDAVHVVRCKDCKYLNAPANGVPFCKRIKKFVDADWFCADGEKSS